jgi:hypothetical protein
LPLILSPVVPATMPQPAPLIVKSQGSFFVGGEKKKVQEPATGQTPAQDGDITADEQFPIESVDEFYKQMIPELNSTLPKKLNPTWAALATLAARLYGVVLVGHSESGFFPERAALLDPKDVKGIVSIETDCETDLNPRQVSVLAKIPTLVLFGDHLEDVALTLTSGAWTWGTAFASCETFIGQLTRGGGDAQMMHLPSLGIKGNSHMLMQDKNSDQIAGLVVAWIGEHVRLKGER